MVYRPHVREYSFGEVQQIFSTMQLDRMKLIIHFGHIPLQPDSCGSRC